MFDKRYQVHRTFFTVKHFPNSVRTYVDAAIYIYYAEYMQA